MAPWCGREDRVLDEGLQARQAHDGPGGTVVVETSEDNFQVEEKGLAEGDAASYLLGKTGGKWFVVDKKRGGGFSDDGIKLGYKGWFDKVEKKEE